MSRYCKRSVMLMALAAAIVLCCAPESLAKKPGGGEVEVVAATPGKMAAV